MQNPAVTAFYDEKTGSVQYVAADPVTRHCAIIDPVWNYDEKSGRTSTESMDDITAFVSEHGLIVEWILDTHPHADHFTAAALLAEYYGAPCAIGEKVTEVQKIWKDIYHLGEDFHTDGRQWDRLLVDGDVFRVGELEVRVMFSPGHTAASVTYVMGDAAFVHDSIFMPDSGTARADFPGGDARALYRSIHRILELPDETRLFTGHDYRPGGRRPLWASTVREQRASNTHWCDGPTEEEYVGMRKARDATLPLPNLMLAALQVNIRGGCLPEAESDGHTYLRIPLNRF